MPRRLEAPVDLEAMDRDQLRAQAQTLRADIAPYRATSLVTAVLLHEAAKQHQKNRDRDPHVSIAEYLALLLVDRVRTADGPLPTESVVADAADRAFAILDALHGDEVRIATEAAPEPGDLTFAQRFRIAGLALRNPGVPEHWSELLNVFAREFDPEIERCLPFSLRQCLAIAGALPLSMIDRSRKREARWQDVTDSLCDAYRKNMVPKEAPGDLDVARLFDDIRINRLQYRRTISRRIREYSLRDVDSLGLVDVHDVAQRASVQPAIVEEFAALFAVDSTITEEWLVLPSSHNALSRTPFIKTTRGYFTPYLPLLQWAILPRIEQLLNPASPNAVVSSRIGWNRYERQRARFLEGMTARIFERVSDELPKRNFTFTLDDPSVQYEIDVCAHFDTTKYVVECKSKTLAEATRRGAELSLERDVREILRKATIQLARAVGSLTKGKDDSPEGAIDEFIPIVVTLDHTGPISAGIRAAAYDEAVRGAQAPWVLSLLELYTLQDLLETPWRFKHYARQRLLAVTQRRDTLAIDELDFYQTYRYFNVCAMPPGASHFVVVAPTDEVDDYYSMLNARKRKKPSPAVPPAIRRLFDDLEHGGHPGWSDIACDFLDFPHSVLKKLADAVVRMQTRTANGGTAIWRLREPVGGWGLIYVATSADRLRDELLMAQLQMKPSEEGTGKCLFIVHDVRTRRIEHGVYVARGGHWSGTLLSSLKLGDEARLLSLAVPDQLG